MPARRSAPPTPPQELSSTRPALAEGEDVGVDGFVRHRCTCRRRTVLGSYGMDEAGRFSYKIMWRDRVMLVYFGSLSVRCRDCTRWTRVRILPKEKKADFTPMKTRDEAIISD